MRPKISKILAGVGAATAFAITGAATPAAAAPPSDTAPASTQVDGTRHGSCAPFGTNGMRGSIMVNKAGTWVQYYSSSQDNAWGYTEWTTVEIFDTLGRRIHYRSMINPRGPQVVGIHRWVGRHGTVAVRYGWRSDWLPDRRCSMTLGW